VVPDSISILVADEGRELARQLESVFSHRHVVISHQKDVDTVLAQFESQSFDLLVVTTSACRAGDTDGLELIELVRENSPATQILFLVEQGDIQTAMSALKAGTYQYATLPIGNKELRLLVETALEKKPTYGTNLLRRDRPAQVIFEKLIGRSPPMQHVYQQIRQAAATDIPVLLLGETGTGKDLAAQAIHQQSRRRGKPFVAVNLGALPPELVPSELFGHEKGSFTGAMTQREGKFEQARDGTIFLDEIDTIDEKVAIGLLRLLEEKQHPRLGGKHAIRTNARLIAASNRDLAQAVADGTFRKDLYYRLDVFQLVLPPLRERQGDIAILMDEFLKRFNHAYQKGILGVAPECVSMLETYGWPGNVRELKNVIQRAVLVCAGEVLLPEHLPPRFTCRSRPCPQVTLAVGTPLRDVEKEMIRRTLALCKNNRQKAAALLGISRRALYNKLARYGLR